MKTTFNYSTQYYFPNNIKLIGVMLIIAGLVLFTLGHILASVIFLFLGMFIFLTKYGIELDLENKTYLDYLSLFGYKKGAKIKFESIESIYITSSKKTTRMQLRAARNTLTTIEYNGYIKFSEHDKVHLMSSEKKADIEKLLTQMSNEMKVPFDDFSKAD